MVYSFLTLLRRCHHRVIRRSGSECWKGRQWEECRAHLTTMSGAPTPRVSQRMLAVQGSPQCYNDLLYCSPLDSSDHLSTVLFFPGDVQNFKEVMEKECENKELIKWSLEDVGSMLQSCFRTSHVLIIKPSRIEGNVIACYDHFVHCDVNGAPDHGDYSRAVPHLEALLNSASAQLPYSVHTPAPDTTTRNSELKLSEGEIQLIGFSKGCVVLNQLVYELCSEVEGAYLKHRLTSLRWLDSGNPGSVCAYITSKPLLQRLANLQYELRVEVTPYQVVQRSWLAAEERIFTQTLKALGANISRRLHFSRTPPSLINHFRLLDICLSST